MRVLTWLAILTLATPCWAASGSGDRQEAEYYVAAYAQHYRVPVEFVRALVEQESAWRRCAISSKGAVGLMQLMPETARRLGVQDRCDLQQNISGRSSPPGVFDCQVSWRSEACCSRLLRRRAGGRGQGPSLLQSRCGRLCDPSPRAI
ncbi:MAG: transglycosylase SLT domain-containing protein [Actinomycetota bacterium]